ncbi:MAG: DUF1552 domain-containing protein [Bradymonadia bacterium]
MRRRAKPIMPSRRQFLRGLGGVTLGLPFLPSLLPRKAWGQTDLFPRRLIVFHTANGQPMRLWTPTGEGADFQMSTVLAPLEAHKQDLIVLKGPDMVAAREAMEMGITNNGHAAGTTTALTAALMTKEWAGGISVDQFIAQRVGRTTRLPSLELAVETIPSPLGRISYRGADLPVPPEQNPRQAWTRLFSDFTRDFDVRDVEGLNPRDATILDSVKADYDRIKTQLSAGDRIKLEAHLEQIRSLEDRLKIPLPPVGGACEIPDVADFDALTVDGNPDRFGAVGRMHMDLIVMALACDITRVTSLMWQEGSNDLPFTFLPQPVFQSHHSISHTLFDGTAPEETVEERALVAINRWYAEQFAYLITELKKIPEGTGTLLDNTTLIWTNELSDGHIHNHNDMPYVIAGKGGGYFDTGRFVQTFDKPHNDVLVSIMHAMGLDDVNEFGVHGTGGPLPGLAV